MLFVRKGDAMTIISIRGVDDQAVFRLKKQAQLESSSLNSLLVKVLETFAGVREPSKGQQRFDDLDALQGTWSQQDAEAFEHATADFAQIDSTIWK